MCNMESSETETYSPLNGFAVGHSANNGQTNSLSDSGSSNDNVKSTEELESEMITLQREFRKYYRKTLVGIEDCDDVSAAKNGQLHVLLKYLEQLEEQNDFLIETMVELEKEACERVLQMERRLKSSAKSTMTKRNMAEFKKAYYTEHMRLAFKKKDENDIATCLESVINLHQWEQEMQRLVNERIQMESSFLNMQRQVSSTVVENNFLRDQNFNLNHDIQALLHIIQRARSTGHWEVDCVTFCEVTPEQVFGPVQSLEPLCSPRSTSPSLPLPTPKHVAHPIQRFKDNSSETLSEVESSDPSLNVDSSEYDKKKKCRCSNGNTTIGKFFSQRNEATKDAPCSLMAPCSKNLFRSISLPSLWHSSCYSYVKETLSNSKSCSFISRKKYGAVPETRDSDRLKPVLLELPEGSKTHSCQSLCHSSYGSIFRRAYSEPHLFMFGDCIYVYRPCETMHRLSSLSLKGNSNGLHPCQSIDLKLPSESQDCERAWGVHSNARDFPLSHSSSMPCSIDRLSRESCSTSLSKDFHYSAVHSTQVLAHPPHLPPLFIDSKCQTDESFAVLNCCSDDSSCIKKPVISCCIQTENIKSFTIGLQADLNNQDSQSLKRVLSEDTIEGMTIDDVNRSMQVLKTNLLKAEDKVSAQIILIQELQGHLNTVSKNIELKDAAVENIERKLNSSRSECKSLKDEIISLESKVEDLNQELQGAKSMNDSLNLNIQKEKERIDELLSQEKVLQNQKRSLMTQLDAQGDELERQTAELLVAQKKLDKCTVQIEQQNQIIMSLQEALVQSKRAFDEVQRTKNHSIPKKDLQSRSLHSSRSAIVDL